jgi:hypothetical protein
MRIEPFTTTNASKAQTIDALAMAFERGDIRILNDAVLVSELVAYQAQPLPSGLMRYGAPSGQHDDCVMALAIAWTSVAGQNRAIYPVRESDICVKPFRIPASWPRAYGLEVGWGATAVIWGARDPNSDTVYLYDEYYSLDHRLPIDAEAIRSRGAWIRGVMDSEANGRDRTDGCQLIAMYQDLGLDLEVAPNLIESGILDVWQRMITGRLKVFASLENYLQELPRYHRDERGQVVTECDNLQNATRCLIQSGISCMRTEPVARPEYDYEHVVLGDAGWMAY